MRRLATTWGLTYHQDWCHHADRPDAVPVPLAEARKAARLPRFTRVRFEGRVLALNVCRTCCPPVRDWPPKEG